MLCWALRLRRSWKHEPLAAERPDRAVPAADPPDKPATAPSAPAGAARRPERDGPPTHLAAADAPLSMRDLTPAGGTAFATPPSSPDESWAEPASQSNRVGAAALARTDSPRTPPSETEEPTALRQNAAPVGPSGARSEGGRASLQPMEWYPHPHS